MLSLNCKFDVRSDAQIGCDAFIIFEDVVRCVHRAHIALINLTAVDRAERKIKTNALMHALRNTEGRVSEITALPAASKIRDKLHLSL